MKNAEFIKNELYKTLYKTSDDRYKTAVISFTTVRYEDKNRDKIIVFNDIEDPNKKELWKDILAKKISNYDDFITNYDEWEKEGKYIQISDKIRYYEPESDIYVLSDVGRVEIIQVTDKKEDINIAFISIYEQDVIINQITCDFENKDIILDRMISNYGKLCKKGKVTIVENENADAENLAKISSITFVVSDGEVKTYIMYMDEFGKVRIDNTTVEKALNKIESNDNIRVEYKTIIDGKCTAITEEEFKAMVSILPKNRKAAKNDDSDDIDAEINEDDIVDNHSKNRKIAIFTAALALAGIGLYCLVSKSSDNKEKSSDADLKKRNSSSYGDTTTVTTQDDYIVTTIDSYINNDTTATTISNSNVTTTTSNISTTTTSLTNSNSATTTNNSNITTTTNNGYVTTTRPTTAYTSTYRTVNTSDMVTSGTNKTTTTTKSTTQNVVPSGTVNPRDMVTAGSKPGDQVFTKDGATTTTKKATTTTKSTTNYNPYADLIITHEINAATPETNKSLVLKK